MEIETWWKRLGCVRNPGAHSGEESARDDEIAELRSIIERQEQEVLKLHRDLAAENLRADQGWHRYEAANSRKNELEAERANWAQEIVALKAASPVAMPNDGLVPLSVDGKAVWLEGIGAVALDYSSVKSLSDIQDASASLAPQNAIDVLIENHRIEIIPEYEGGFHARAYQDSENPLASFHATTVRAAVEGAIDAASDKDQS